MISRRTATAIGDVYEQQFGYMKYVSGGGSYSRAYYLYRVRRAELYDYLFNREYPAWFCNAARAIQDRPEKRAVKDFVLKLHTGETITAPDWTWEQQEMLGQRFLQVGLPRLHGLLAFKPQRLLSV